MQLTTCSSLFGRSSIVLCLSFLSFFDESCSKLHNFCSLWFNSNIFFSICLLCSSFSRAAPVLAPLIWSFRLQTLPVKCTADPFPCLCLPIRSTTSSPYKQSSGPGLPILDRNYAAKTALKSSCFLLAQNRWFFGSLISHFAEDLQEFMRYPTLFL